MKNQVQRPAVWTFRRCPYAMRARMALDASGLDVEYREVLLRDKPARMLEHSPKGTVPILVLQDGTVLDESIDIMRWSLSHSDPEGWLAQNDEEKIEIRGWLEANDAFKPHLDRYKYPNRFEDVDSALEESACRAHIQKLDEALAATGTLVSGRVTLADVALFPFVRQFNNVDKSKLPSWKLDRAASWLDGLVASERFARVMKKRSLWVGRGRTGGRPSLDPDQQ